MPAGALIIAAPRSSSGKTTITLGLIAALRRRGVEVRAAKTGPDYIDPAFHTAATGYPCFNIDSWAMPPNLVAELIMRGAAGADIMVIEGAMGLFDGVDGPTGRTGCAADIAARFAFPVVLVLDVSGQGQTAAAIVHGLASYVKDVRVAGVILNRVGSDRHRTIVSRAIEALGIPVFGSVPRQVALAVPERHLGLVQADEHRDLVGYLDKLSTIIEEHVDIDAIQQAVAPIPNAVQSLSSLRPPGQCIALARDAAFTFIYMHLLESWRAANATIRLFSPLADEVPPDECDVCWLPGGYPELYAGELASAAKFRAGLQRFAETKPVYGECGGYMVLGEALEDAQGQRHQMLGLLGHTTSFAKRRLALGYRRATLLRHSVLGPPGSVVAGHEFHYATISDAGSDSPFSTLEDSNRRELGTAGGVRGHVSGSFFHVLCSAE